MKWNSIEKDLSQSVEWESEKNVKERSNVKKWREKIGLEIERESGAKKWT